MFKNQHRGLYPLALANTGERFGYYIMLATLVLYMQAKFGFDENMAGLYYSIFLAAVYFMPVVGGWVADKIGFGKCVVTGQLLMIAGYSCMSIPAMPNTGGLILMAVALETYTIVLIMPRAENQPFHCTTWPITLVPCLRLQLLPK